MTLPSQSAIQGRIGNGILGIIFNIAMKSFAIFDQDMTQKIYEDYLGILGVREI